MQLLTCTPSTGSVKPTDAGNVLSTSLKEFHQSHKAVYSFRVQLLQDLEAQPVDDIGISESLVRTLSHGSQN